MPAAGAPVDEDRRQAALDRYHLFDTGAEQAYDDIARLAATVCGTPVALISLIDRDRQRFKARVGLEIESTPRSIALCDRAIREPDRPLIVPDVAADPRFAGLGPAIGGKPLRFYAGVPLRSPEGHGLGTVCVMDVRPRLLEQRQIESLQILARQTQHLLELRCYAREQRRLLAEREAMLRSLEASRAELQQRHDAMEQRAHHDPLTGLLNRAGLERIRVDPDALARLGRGPYCIVVVDIDRFKQINDVHGHLLGDRALRAVGDAVSASVRDGDVAVRYGGEEFLLVLPGTLPAGAAEVAERVRRSVEAIGLPFRVTVSAGVAMGDPLRDTPEQVFQRADQALYRAKAGGRDRVVVDDTFQLRD
jgi:diguanylate cyclase (GGDEF)-like protein